MSKAPLKVALEAQRNLKIEANYHSKLEERIAAQLDAAGIKYDYEGVVVPYAVPARTANYVSDFPITGTKIIIEGKGNFGAGGQFGRWSNMKDNSAKERQKFALLKEQHPELDIRFVFSRANAPIYKGSKTTHAKWSADHGFLWSEKVIPQSWLDEMKGTAHGKSNARTRTKSR